MIDDGIRGTIGEYRRSCVLVQSRICQLDRLIELHHGTSAASRYARRRAWLGQELWEMLGAIHQLEEYQQLAEGHSGDAAAG